MHRHAFRREQTSRNRSLVALLFNVLRFDASGPAARTISFYWRLRKIENVTAHRRRFICADDLTTLSPKLCRLLDDPFSRCLQNGRKVFLSSAVWSGLIRFLSRNEKIEFLKCIFDVVIGKFLISSASFFVLLKIYLCFSFVPLPTSK